MSKVANLKDDIAYALAASEIRILAPIPGKTAVGVEVPNAVRRIVHLGDVFQDAPAGWSPLTVWLGKDIAGKAIGTDLDQAAARARGRHDRLGQVRLRERDAHVDPAARLPERREARARGPEAGRAEPLRGHPAPDHAGRDEPADRRERAPEPDQGDGAALHGHERRQDAQPGRAEQGAREARRQAAALHPLRDRRARRPDDDRAGRGRGLDHPARAEVPRRRHPPAARDPAPERGHHHRHDQGERARPGSRSPCRRRSTRA